MKNDEEMRVDAKRISQLETGDYEQEKILAYLPASLGEMATKKYNLAEIEKAAVRVVETLVAAEAIEREGKDREIKLALGELLELIASEATEREGKDGEIKSAIGELLELIASEATEREGKDTELKNAIEKFLSGSKKQVRLGDGTLSAPEGIDGEEFNAASSLFAEGDIREDALDSVYGEFENKGCRISWENFVVLLGREMLKIFKALGLLDPPSNQNIINSVSVSITSPVHGEILENEVIKLDDNPNYEVGDVVWVPDDEIASGFNSYNAVFTIYPSDLNYIFSPLMDLRVNGKIPAKHSIENDGSWRIIVEFPKEYTWTPIESVAITFDIPVEGENP